MRTTNYFIIRGRVGQAPKAFQSAAKLRIATDRVWTDTEGKKHEETDWVTITVLNEKSAAWAIANIGKGDMVYAECRIAESSFKNRNGDIIHTTDIFANVLNKIVSGSREDHAG